MGKNKKRELNLSDEEIIKNIGEDYETNWDLGIKEAYNLPRILLNRARDKIKKGKYLEAKIPLDNFEFLERIILEENFIYNGSEELRQDYENLKRIRRIFKNKYGPTRYENSKEKDVRPYEQ